MGRSCDRKVENGFSRISSAWMPGQTSLNAVHSAVVPSSKSPTSWPLYRVSGFPSSKLHTGRLTDAGLLLRSDRGASCNAEMLAAQASRAQQTSNLARFFSHSRGLTI